MLKDLPEFVQKQILYYLGTDNFTAAKALHDAWIRHQTVAQNNSKKSSKDTNDDIFISKQQVSLIEDLLNEQNSKGG